MNAALAHDIHRPGRIGTGIAVEPGLYRRQPARLVTGRFAVHAHGMALGVGIEGFIPFQDTLDRRVQPVRGQCQVDLQGNVFPAAKGPADGGIEIADPILGQIQGFGDFRHVKMGVLGRY